MRIPVSAPFKEIFLCFFLSQTVKPPPAPVAAPLCFFPPFLPFSASHHLLSVPRPISSPPPAWFRGGQKSKRKIKYKKTLSGGSTNMPLFGRVHECKEHEQWSEKQVWIVSVMKWALPKNQEDPYRDTSKTRVRSGWQTNTKALILKQNDVSKCLYGHTKDPSSL